MDELIRKKVSGKKVLLLGFGREGQATYSLIRKLLPECSLSVADRDPSVMNNKLLAGDDRTDLILGENYLSGLERFDLIIRSPGIPLHNLEIPVPDEKITSQTDLFLQFYSKQIVGVTGTKGKSTTATLIWHILRHAGCHSLLLGNIGRPPFDLLQEIRPETIIVQELSSHQLENVSASPAIAVMLNLYQEHLDAYKSFLDYQLSKMNIRKFQDDSDYFIYHAGDDLLHQRMLETESRSQNFPFSITHSYPNGSYISEGFAVFARNGKEEKVLDLKKKRELKGDHNLLNILAVITTCRILGIDSEYIREGIRSFKGLEHRLEFSGIRNEIIFYNDSIATIPEASIEAVKALVNVDTIILGGFDRGIDYSGLAGFMASSQISNFIFTGEAGLRIREGMEALKKQHQHFFTIQRFDEFLDIALHYTRPGTICLLSPAAASYNEFQNFEIRGKRFKELILPEDKKV